MTCLKWAVNSFIHGLFALKFLFSRLYEVESKVGPNPIIDLREKVKNT